MLTPETTEKFSPSLSDGLDGGYICQVSNGTFEIRLIDKLPQP